MTEDFETATRDQTLYDVIGLMLDNEVDHVIVLDDDIPSAVITRRKVLVASYKTDSPPSDIPLSAFSRGIDTSTDPNATVLVSVGKMQNSKNQCIPVVDGVNLVGVLTKDDIIENISNITSGIFQHEDKRGEWTHE